MTDHGNEKLAEAVRRARNEASRRAAPLVAQVDRLFVEYYGEVDGFPPPLGAVDPMTKLARITQNVFGFAKLDFASAAAHTADRTYTIDLSNIVGGYVTLRIGEDGVGALTSMFDFPESLAVSVIDSTSAEVVELNVAGNLVDHVALSRPMATLQVSISTPQSWSDLILVAYE